MKHIFIYLALASVNIPFMWGHTDWYLVNFISFGYCVAFAVNHFIFYRPR